MAPNGPPRPRRIISIESRMASRMKVFFTRGLKHGPASFQPPTGRNRFRRKAPSPGPAPAGPPSPVRYLFSAPPKPSRPGCEFRRDRTKLLNTCSKVSYNDSQGLNRYPIRRERKGGRRFVGSDHLPLVAPPVARAGSFSLLIAPSAV
jgi:hypothetical protein